jgi:ureidoacrylate peracid hydrolase
MTVRLPGGSSALVLVDLQNAFCHPKGGRARIVGAERSRDAVALPAAVVPLVTLARSQGLAVWWTLMHDRPGSFARPGRARPATERRGGAVSVCPAGSWDAELVDAAAALRRPEDHEVVKHRASAFFGTDLDQRLRAAGVDTLVVAGTTTSYCVESTVRDAFARDYDVVVVADCVADTDPAAQAASLAAMDRFHGWVASLDELAAALA